MQMPNAQPQQQDQAGRSGAVLAVPSDDMLILSLVLPRLAPSQRALAALYAVEPFVAQPLEEVQVVLGPQLGPEPAAPWLVVVLAKTAFADLMARHGARRVRLVPDALLMPRPPDGQWCVSHATGRFVARLPDGTGFAAAEAAFRAIWAQSGSPQIQWVAGAPVPDLPMAPRSAALSEPLLARFDLGAHRVPAWRQPFRLGALAAVLILGICGHLGLMAYGNQHLSQAVQSREAALRLALSDRGITIGPSVEATAAAALQRLGGSATTGFLPDLSSALAALAPQSGQIALQDISYDSSAGRLSFTMVAPELGLLQDAAALLTEAGLQSSLGTSTISDGQARATVSITWGAAG